MRGLQRVHLHPNRASEDTAGTTGHGNEDTRLKTDERAGMVLALLHALGL